MPISSTDIHGKTITVHDHERQRCDVYSRVMGYIMMLSNWNEGKKSEHAERKPYIPPTIPDEQFTLPL